MFNLNTYFVREHVGMLKLSDTYDILNPETEEQIAVAQERPGTMVHILRFLVNKQLLPTRLDIHYGDDPKTGEMAFSIKRGPMLFGGKVHILDPQGNVMGYFKPKVWSLKVRFKLFGSDDNQVGSLEGDWKGWNFKFLDANEEEIGVVTKKWAGIGKELFTSADNYIVSLHGDPDPARATLLLAASLTIDLVRGERG